MDRANSWEPARADSPSSAWPTWHCVDHDAPFIEHADRLECRQGHSVSFVNGYTCYSSCDAAAARSGKDPHPNTPDTGDAQKTSATGARRDDAVQFGGALAGLNSGQQTSSDASGKDSAVGSLIDRLI